MRRLLTSTIVFVALFTIGAAVLPAREQSAPRIAPWFRNYDGAVSLRFDDNLDSHRTLAIPLLERYGFHALFMVSPGTRRYREYREFWEKRVPAMGHRLGNHTMNHRGGHDLAEADYEIGEAARIIRRAYPSGSELLVFASGGGKKWGGSVWEQADPTYYQIAEKYHLIDLYDGKHRSFRVDGSSRVEQLCERIDRTADEMAHQPFHFHGIGKPKFLDRLKTLVRGVDMTTNEETFSGMLRCLTERRERIWIAPLIDILKYEEEVRGASIKVRTSTQNGYTLVLMVQTDPVLYDHRLTVVLPVRKGKTIGRVMVDKEEHRAYKRTRGEVLVDVKPINSTIKVHFN